MSMLKKLPVVTLTLAATLFATQAFSEDAAPAAAPAEAAPAAAPAAALDGKAVFLAQNCNSCHTVTAQGIAVENPEAKEEGDKDPPDLSKAGETLTKQFIAGYLMKKEDIKGEKHKKRFRGTPEELKAVATWLSELK